MLVTSNTLALPSNKSQCVHLEVDTTSEKIHRCQNQATLLNNGWLCSYHSFMVANHVKPLFQAQPDREVVAHIRKFEPRAIAAHAVVDIDGIRQFKYVRMKSDPEKYAREAEQLETFIKFKKRDPNKEQVKA